MSDPPTEEYLVELEEKLPGHTISRLINEIRRLREVDRLKLGVQQSTLSMLSTSDIKVLQRDALLHECRQMLIDYCYEYIDSQELMKKIEAAIE